MRKDGDPVKMKVIIVDDEELSLKRLSNMLADISGVETCGLFYTADEALQYIVKNQVDAVFLDICIPEIDGLTLANRILDIDSSINVVFVTGYDEYAVTAFELDAVDYLMKPISRSRLEKTVQRLQRAGAGGQSSEKIKVTCFGGFSVSAFGSASSIISWRSPKTEELFAFLIFKGNVSRDEIVNTLWDGLDPDKALKNLNSTMYYIRKALGRCGMESVIAANHKQIRINADLVSCDLYEFENLLNDRQGSKDYVHMLDRLTMLYRGELFQGKAYEWSFPKSRSLESGFIGFLLETADYHMENLRYEKAESIYKSVLEMDSFSEYAYGNMIKICLMTGRKTEAKRLYLRLENLLMNELGERPQDKLRKLIE